MYKHVHSMLPQVFDHLFSFSSSVHSYETRSSSKGDLFVLQNRTLYFRNSSFQRGVKYWNGLTDNLKECKTVVAFAKELKKTTITTSYAEIEIQVIYFYLGLTCHFCLVFVSV